MILFQNGTFMQNRMVRPLIWIILELPNIKVSHFGDAGCKWFKFYSCSKFRH